MLPNKAVDLPGRWREVISDPLNLLIERVSAAGGVSDGHVYLHNGIRVPINREEAYYGTFSLLLIINRGVHEPLEEYIFQELLKTMPDAPTMLELGAYWAHYSLWLKARRPAATVIMVEPEPRNMAVGVQNFAFNGYQGEFINDFVGHGRFQVDGFLKSRNIDHLDILHADIQEYEMQMLEGGGSSLARHAVDYVFISTHTQQLHQQVVDTLSGHGYRIEVSSDFDSHTTSCDGLVFASSPKARQLFDCFRPLGRVAVAESTPDQQLRYLVDIRTAGASTKKPANPLD